MKKIMVALLIILAGCSSINSISSQPQEKISWVDIVMWNDAKYTYNYEVYELNQLWKTGEELGEVSFMMNDHANSNHIMENGHATYLTVGTKLYAMEGYDPVFRIIADGKIYEIEQPAEAKILNDFLDITGKVDSVWFLSEQDSTPLFPMDDEVTQSFVDQFLALPYTPYAEIYKKASGNRTFIEFRLQDGTSMQTVFWIDNKVFTIGAIGTDTIQEIIEKEWMLHTE